MRLPQVQINPTSRIASALHIIYRLLLPLLVLGLVRSGFVSAAAVIIVLSKWRMLAVRPRYWVANIRANSVDMVVGFAVVIFMSTSDSLVNALIWAGLYACWLLFLKPRSSPLMVSIQALTSQALGIVAVFNNYHEWNQAYLVLIAWLICLTASRHFLNAFEDDSARALSHVWALFGAELALVLGRWNIIYLEVVPQLAMVLTVVGYTLAIAYYLHKTRGLSASAHRQFIIMAIVLLLAIIAFSEWQAETF